MGQHLVLDRLQQFFPDFIVTAAILVITAFGKKIIRGRRQWKVKDWALGPDFLMASFGAGIVYLVDWPGQSAAFADLLFMLVVIIFFMIVISFHQDFKKEEKQEIDSQEAVKAETKGTIFWRLFWLCGVCNIIGVSMLAGFLLLIKTDFQPTYFRSTNPF